MRRSIAALSLFLLVSLASGCLADSGEDSAAEPSHAGGTSQGPNDDPGDGGDGDPQGTGGNWATGGSAPDTGGASPIGGGGTGAGGAETGGTGGAETGGIGGMAGATGGDGSGGNGVGGTSGADCDVALSWEAEHGAISSPFAVADDGVSQNVATTDPTAAGRAEYCFTVPESGTYVITARVTAPSLGSNSVFVGVDDDPTGDADIWDIPVSTSPTERTLTVRGDRDAEANHPHLEVVLDAGVHTLVVLGREPGVVLDAFEVRLADSEPPPPAPTNLIGSNLPQSIVDYAVAHGLVSFKAPWYIPEGDNGTVGAKVVFVLGLVTHANPDAKTSAGASVRERFVAQIENLTRGGSEPTCWSGLAGWSDNSMAWAFLLARRTPEVFDALSAVEQERIDWIMRAMAVAGHFLQDDGNDFKEAIKHNPYETCNAQKHWNPNLTEGPLGQIIAASIYFGPTELDSWFEQFDYDASVAELQRLGLTNILEGWQGWKSVFENGGADSCGGSGAGIRNSFTYEGVPLDDPMDLFAEYAAERTYGKTVINGIPGKSWILSGEDSPWLGQKGMCWEYDTIDAQGVRSDATYVQEGQQITLSTIAALYDLGEWNGSGAQRLDPLVAVGPADHFFKVEAGYQSYSKGRSRVTTPQSVASYGYFYDKELYAAFADLHLN